MPYVFQILAALLESDPGRPLPDTFKTLIAPLMLPPLWETRGNVPGCARFLAAIIPKAKEAILAENQLEPILGIFQRLMSGKKSEQNAFDVLEAIISTFPAQVSWSHTKVTLRLTSALVPRWIRILEPS